MNAQNAELYECALRLDLLSGRRVVSVNDKEYLHVRNGDGSHSFTKLGEGAETYTVREGAAPDGEVVLVCDCPDFTFRRKRQLKLSCKHCLAVGKIEGQAVA